MVEWKVGMKARIVTEKGQPNRGVIHNFPVGTIVEIIGVIPMVFGERLSVEGTNARTGEVYGQIVYDRDVRLLGRNKKRRARNVSQRHEICGNRGWRGLS